VERSRIALSNSAGMKAPVARVRNSALYTITPCAYRAVGL